MHLLEAREEYQKALKAGQKEAKDCRARGISTAPLVLERILPTGGEAAVKVGLVEIPVERIVGTKTAGRITAFSPSFMPLLSEDTEFAHKWMLLCAAHLSEEGIREPIVCFEYLGNFYVQEGNKRVSVLRHFGATRIPGYVTRLMPPPSQDPEIVAYREFLDFYEDTGLYDVRYRQPGDYARLLSYLGKEPGEKWTEQECKTFRAYFHYFREAFYESGGATVDIHSAEALLLWLKVYPYKDLGRLSSSELKKTMVALRDDLAAQTEPLELADEPTKEQKAGLLTRWMSFAPEHVAVAFIHSREPSISPWITTHEEGASYLKSALGDRVTVRSYFHADTPELAEQLIDQAVEEGAQVIFTTTPQLSRPTLKAAVKHPKVRFFNCSVNTPYSSVRSYYGRVFEGKFITGAIAGAMSENDSIGYIGSYPIFGVPTGINAFALGAQLTNPRAKVQLRWSCLPGNHVEEFRKQDIHVISNKDAPTPDKLHQDFGGYGTYVMEENGDMVPLASPFWRWGKFYEHVVRSILAGTWEDNEAKAVNYWWGVRSGVIDVALSDKLPEGLRLLVNMLRRGLRDGSIEVFRRHLVAQDGRVINDGSRSLDMNELLHMDWLCENVEGRIPQFDELLPFAQPTVRELGIYRDSIPMEKEDAN